MNQNALMAAAAAGNVALVEALPLNGGADQQNVDHFGTMRCTGRCARRFAIRLFCERAIRALLRPAARQASMLNTGGTVWCGLTSVIGIFSVPDVLGVFQVPFYA